MSEQTAEDRIAAQIAVEILDRADEGTRLFTLNKYFPRGRDAFSFGFHLTLGGIVAFSLVLVIANAAERLWDWITP